jgi:rRNA biogenesis protein RRP5
LTCAVIKPNASSSSRTSKKHIELTIRESVLNKELTIDNLRVGMSIVGAVKSVEDHGYIVSFGFPECTGFIKRQNVESLNIQKEAKTTKEDNEENKPIVLRIGQPVKGLITEIDLHTKTVFIDIDPKKVATKTVHVQMKQLNKT